MQEKLKSILFEKEKNLKELPREFLLYQDFSHFNLDQILLPALIIHQKEDPQICGLKYQILKIVALNHYRHPADKSTIYLHIRNILGISTMNCDIIKKIEIFNEKDESKTVNFEILLNDKVIENDNIFFFLDLTRNCRIKINNAENIESIRIIFTNYLLCTDTRREIINNFKEEK